MSSGQVAPRSYQIGQSQQQRQPLGVLDQPPGAAFGIPEAPLHPQEGILHLGPVSPLLFLPPPLDDHGTSPTLLVVLEDALAAIHFLRVTGKETARAGVTVPLLVCHRGCLSGLDPWVRLGEQRRFRTRILSCSYPVKLDCNGKDRQDG